MTTTLATRAEIVSILRTNGKGARADWFERELPEIVDIGKNRSLLATLDIDPDSLSKVGSVPQEPPAG